MRILIYLISIFVSFGLIFNLSYAQTATVDRAQLENELKALEAEIETQKKVIQSKQTEGKSLSRDITILESKIKQKEAEIKASDKTIKNLSYDIQEKEKNIQDLTKKVDKELDFVGNTLRKMQTSPDNDFVLNILSENTLSSSVDNLNNLSNLKSSLGTSVKSIKNTKAVLEDVATQLESKKEKEESLKSKQLVQKQEIDANKKEKATILQVTKGEEKKYQALVADNQKKAAHIRSKLFSFHDGTQVNFGDLYRFSKSASAATGVRTEFILAILEQESGYGVDIGSCYVSNDNGDLVGMNTGSAKGQMRPDSLEPFRQITSALGRDFNKTRVSCSLSYGYGGAMGMSQFMPATWIIYASKIASSLGVSYADPWNPAHAIMGTAYMLSQDGASSQGYESERNAACKYYSGRGCASSSNGAKYGNQVMGRIQGIQDKIAIMIGN